LLLPKGAAAPKFGTKEHIPVGGRPPVVEKLNSGLCGPWFCDSPGKHQMGFPPVHPSDSRRGASRHGRDPKRATGDDHS